ncbi:TonB-dependent receptor domain-containing protein [Pontibacter sp. G13]|uniref:TonB-dependent receptor domain-containing protein n=1 Tax=Pontibacter sp. G13 TaxID=3074898 RepID=UPI002889B126|nr:TonB-dependent receptor [Pontibacter sp. G13]WNJ21632.1 TonB-dependent receptor [Pontibacter sp. G13]
MLHAQTAQLSGQVVDSLDRVGLAYASVALFDLDTQQQVTGVLADSTGSFRLTGLSSGTYRLQVRFMGYRTYELTPLELPQGAALDLQQIPIQPTTRILDEIEIAGRQRKTLHQVDRQVFDAEQFQQAQGGTAVDVLRNLPGVSVDAQGQISMRGSSGFVVMLDGRQVQMDAATLLAQLPANAIEHIEILTTPSAKYDPDGTAGIINITTRKGAADGWFVQLNGLIGAPSIEPYGNAEASRRWGGDATINYRKGDWDVSAGLDYRRDDLAGRRVGYVNSYLGGVLTEFPSEGERSFDKTRYSGRLSATYSPNKDHQLSMSFLVGDRTQYRTADILYAPQQRLAISEADFRGVEAYWDLYREQGSIFTQGDVVDSLTYYNENLRVREGDFLIGGIDYTWKLDGQGTLAFSALYERTLLGGPTENVVLGGPDLADSLQFQYNTNDNPLDGLRVKADYRRKLGDADWESGYQYRMLYHPGDFLYQDRDFANDEWVDNPVFTNRIELRRQIHGVYTQLSGTWHKLQYVAGVRVEYMDRQVTIAKPDTTYAYQIVQPFPTLNLRYPLGESTALKAGYSRRIQRTTTFKMTPFPEREHNETLEQGDAELLPEFIDLAEIGIVHNWGDQSVFLNTYYRHVQNVINRVNTVYNDSVLNRIYTNAGNAQAIGAEAGADLYPAKWCQLHLGGNVYQYRIQGTLFGDEIDVANLIYSINANAQFDLTGTLSLQAGFNYLSERVTAQGRDSRYYNPSLTLRKTFLDGKLAASVQWLSIDMGLLESNEQRITTVRPDFFTTTNYIYEVDRVMFSIQYRFNQPAGKVKFIQSEFGESEY